MKSKTNGTSNLNRMCGKKSLIRTFPSEFESQKNDFDEVAHNKPLYGVESLHKSSLES